MNWTLIIWVSYTLLWLAVSVKSIEKAVANVAKLLEDNYRMTTFMPIIKAYTILMMMVVSPIMLLVILRGHIVVIRLNAINYRLDKRNQKLKEENKKIEEAINTIKDKIQEDER